MTATIVDKAALIGMLTLTSHLDGWRLLLAHYGLCVLHPLGNFLASTESFLSEIFLDQQAGLIVVSGVDPALVDVGQRDTGQRESA